MVSVQQYNEFILPITRELVHYAEKDLNMPIWMHNSEILLNHVISHLPLGVSIEGIGPAGDMRQIREATRGRQAISGNLDPIDILWKGKPEIIASEVKRIMGICKEGGGFVMCTGEMNPREIPEENMDAYMTASQKLAEY